MPVPPQYQTLDIAFPQWPGWDTRHMSMSRLSTDCLTDADLSRYANGCDCVSTGCPKVIPLPHAPGPGVISSLDVTVDSASHDDYSSDSPVFHATAAAPSAASLALKFALREDLIPALYHEAHIYATHLRRVQGNVVPWCWGFFVGTSDITGERVACLVLEYWGQALPVRFGDLQKELRMYILDKLKEIHRCGVHHGDFAERNILYTEGSEVDIRIIDFDQTEAHRCNAASCDLLWQVGKDMEVWA